MSLWELPDLERVRLPAPDPKHPVRMNPIGWGEVPLCARLTYLRFANVVERARREVCRERPEWVDILVIPVSPEADYPNRWGETVLGVKRTWIYQMAYETMPDPENYYRQIKAVLRHEFAHAFGDDLDEPTGAIVRPA